MASGRTTPTNSIPDWCGPTQNALTVPNTSWSECAYRLEFHYHFTLSSWNKLAAINGLHPWRWHWYVYTFNPLQPSDVIWWHSWFNINSGNGLLPVAPSHYLNQCWLIISKIWFLISRTRDTSVINYRKTSNISRTLVGNKIVDNSDVVGASPVGAAPTTSSFST